jgi:cation diffusion facilitator family transporter
MDNLKDKTTEKWIKIGIFANIALAIVKGWAGLVSNSSAMIADAMNSTSDIVSSVFIFVSLKIAKKPPDKKHPYGHYKVEVIASMVIGLMLGMLAYQVVSTGIRIILRGNYSTPGSTALYVAVLSIIVKEVLYRFTYKAGIESNSPATIANAKDHRSDVLATSATFLGILGARMGYPILDPLAGIIISGFIAKMAFEILMEATGQIMDESADENKIKEIEEIAEGVKGVVNAHDIRMRRSGSVYLIDMDIVVPSYYTIKEAHDVCEVVREKIFEDIDNTKEVIVHIDPS